MEKKRKLNPKQRKFAELMTSGKYTQAKAAELAGYSGADLSSTGSRLMKNPTIKAYVESKLILAGERNEVSIDEQIAWLRKIREQAFANGDMGNAARATEALGRFIGMFDQKINMNVTRADSGHSTESLNRIAKLKRNVPED